MKEEEEKMWAKKKEKNRKNTIRKRKQNRRRLRQLQAVLEGMEGVRGAVINLS